MQEKQTRQLMQEHVERFRPEIVSELQIVNLATDVSKDIIIVIHNQLSYLKVCIDSIIANTKNFHLYLWDNASDTDTEAYLKELMYKYPNQVDVMRSPTNLGFIEPNNEMVNWGIGEYVILLNSDTKVFDGWDKALTGYLQQNSDVAQVGYLGGVLNEEGKGVRADFGSDVDYICGFCTCLKRTTFEQYGLFDKRLKFAYCEDADLSLRLKSAGFKIYALHLMLVHHYENKTIIAVQSEGSIDVLASFTHNHKFLREKWSEYLTSQRVDLKHDTENIESN